MSAIILILSNDDKLIHGGWPLSKNYYDQTELNAPFSLNPAKTVSKAKVNTTPLLMSAASFFLDDLARPGRSWRSVENNSK